jgi:hypothetical protein
MGCAPMTSTPGGTLSLAAPCLPPGISEEFFFWPIRAHRPITLRVEGGETATAAWVLYGRGNRAVAVVWAGVRV